MAKRIYETPEYLAMLRRMIKAGGTRVAQADEIELADLVSLRGALDEAITEAVMGQKGRVSWAGIGQATGTTRQAAWQKWGKA